MAGIGRRAAAQGLRAHRQGQGAARRVERVLERDQHHDRPARTIAMQKVITINLNGNAYQLDERGYDAMRAYLEQAERQLAGNPDQAEILADLEQAIA